MNGIPTNGANTRSRSESVPRNLEASPRNQIQQRATQSAPGSPNLSRTGTPVKGQLSTGSKTGPVDRKFTKPNTALPAASTPPPSSKLDPTATYLKDLSFGAKVQLGLAAPLTKDEIAALIARTSVPFEPDTPVMRDSKTVGKELIGELKAVQGPALTDQKPPPIPASFPDVVSTSSHMTGGPLPQPPLWVNSTPLVGETKSASSVAPSVVEERIKVLADILEKSGSFSGVILVQDGINPASISVVSPDSRINATTPFNIASIGKMVTSTIALGIAERCVGGVNEFLERPLGSFFSREELGELEFTLEPSGERVSLSAHLRPDEMAAFADASETMTIRSLMNHESGVTRDLSKETTSVYQNDKAGVSVYSNFGYNLVARVIEKITGMPFADYVRTVFADQGIVAYAHPDDAPDQAARTGYGFEAGGLTPHTKFNAWENRADGMGCWYMNADNLNKFLRGVHEGAFFSKSTMDIVYAEPNASFSFNVSQKGGEVVIGKAGNRKFKSGDVMGIAGPRGLVTTVILSNSGGAPGRHELKKVLDGQPPEKVVMLSILSAQFDSTVKTAIQSGNYDAAVEIMVAYDREEAAMGASYDTQPRDLFGTMIYAQMKRSGDTPNWSVVKTALDSLKDDRNNFPPFRTSDVQAAIQGLSDKLVEMGETV